jgi:mannosyltransferase OCH1-like enzyme
MNAMVVEIGDLFRMLVLYRYGGIYVDFDSILFSDFGPMLGKEFWARYALLH